MHVGQCVLLHLTLDPPMTLKSGDAWLQLIQLVATIETDLGRNLHAKHSLGLSEYRALEVLDRSPNSELRMQELAKYLCLNQSSVSRMVERLERTGATVRDICPDDKRGVYTVLTDVGRERLKKARPDYLKALDLALKKHHAEKLLANF